ncbi:alpha/beta hydrolase [Cupriavidus alkaliphilus]|uniref:alpha/beta hydrolase n=1 Tax=Cupriavidus alkaliphilus TaxID=942866 RepID=UPI00162016D5|nr:esterase [Cupriavidus alkaliphilus]MBB2919663.1 phospholipase/carboxylesterase [Cupriavidus alkaliphilus]
MIDPSLLGRLSFTTGPPTGAPLPPGHHAIEMREGRDAVLFVPHGLAAHEPAPLMVMFHGAGGFPEKVLPHLEAHAQRHKFLVLAPHSLYPTWDIVIGGNGPDLQRLHQALTAVTSRHRIDPRRLAFAGFSDGASYALSLGITNGDIASHVIAFSGGFMSVFMQTGIPKVFVAHGLADEQLPIASGRAHAARLRAAGYDVEYVEFDGPHVIHAHVVERAIDFFLQ